MSWITFAIVAAIVWSLCKGGPSGLPSEFNHPFWR